MDGVLLEGRAPPNVPARCLGPPRRQQPRAAGSVRECVSVSVSESASVIVSVSVSASVSECECRCECGRV
jgi:hypothetical protein